MIFAPYLIFDGYQRIIHFHETLISLPNFLAIPFGVIIGIVLSCSFSKFAKTVCLILTFALIVFYFIAGYDYWDNKVFFGSFTGIINEPVPALNFNDNTGNQINKISSIAVLDFWHSHCGYCFQQFPELQEFYKKYQSNSKIKIVAANLPVDTDSSTQAFAMIDSLGYTFPVWKCGDAYDEIKKEFKFSGVPTTIIIVNDKIKYRGTLKGAEKMIEKMLG